MELPKEIVLEILEKINDANSYVALCKVRKDWRTWIKESTTCLGPNGERNYERWYKWFLQFVIFRMNGWCLLDGSPHGLINFAQFGTIHLKKVTYYRGIKIKETFGGNITHHLYV